MKNIIILFTIFAFSALAYGQYTDSFVNLVPYYQLYGYAAPAIGGCIKDFDNGVSYSFNQGASEDEFLIFTHQYATSCMTNIINETKITNGEDFHLAKSGIAFNFKVSQGNYLNSISDSMTITYYYDSDCSGTPLSYLFIQNNYFDIYLGYSFYCLQSGPVIENNCNIGNEIFNNNNINKR
ncbi:hypothetical protein PPL_12396 [Heterostelium album PN500]|uniref:Uncharacterized protein n=1 Tax=Heterostelium pallidum (strain ATCC 26659 / Pp 5 / PN500) TaxID=670386 RepID=D3BMH6_HETP5|nr:hypothetical protein PPL_12396 [Heterostelium album PN500]EFA77188.1 hypothetical protein PPL_12396 [Heterostelium album PN500]|eukprot:XP_020429317.1 hypothetical protein PPL_12396 [Heterostelium album PN500]